MSNRSTNSVAIVDDMRQDLEEALASSGKSWNRLRTTLIIAFQNYPDLVKCSPESVKKEIMKCAADGLVPDGKEAVILPYFDKEARVHQANYQPMVHGVIKRMKELGGVFEVICSTVREADPFEFDAANPKAMTHKINPFSSNRGSIVGAYVKFVDDSDRVMHVEVMSAEQIEKVRRASKSPNGPAWRDWYEEMCKKAVLRRGSKYISLDNDRVREMIERMDTLFEPMGRGRDVVRLNPFSGDEVKQIAHTSTDDASTTIDATSELEPQPATDASSQVPPSGVQSNGSDQRPAHQEKTRASNKQGEKKKLNVPEIPDADINDENRELVVGFIEKILGIPLIAEDPAKKRETIAATAKAWKDELQADLHGLLKACVDMAAWCAMREHSSETWESEHRVFMHKLRDLVGVDKFDVGQYPD